MSVPEHRLDVVAAEDVAEEIARRHGYGRIPGRLPHPALPPFRPDPSEPRHRLRRILAGLGLDEVVTHALIGPQDLVRSGYAPDDPATWWWRTRWPRRTASSARRSPSRCCLAGGERAPAPPRRVALRGRQDLLDGRRGGSRRASGGDCGHGPIRGVARRDRAARPRGPATSPGSDPRDADVADIKGIVEALHAALGAPRPAFRAESDEERHPHLHPGRGGRIIDDNGRAYGSVGEVAPQVAAAWGIAGRPVIATIHLGQLFALVPDDLRAGGASRDPATRPRSGGGRGRQHPGWRAAACPRSTGGSHPHQRALVRRVPSRPDRPREGVVCAGPALPADRLPVTSGASIGP